MQPDEKLNTDQIVHLTYLTSQQLSDILDVLDNETEFKTLLNALYYFRRKLSEQLENAGAFRGTVGYNKLLAMFQSVNDFVGYAMDRPHPENYPPFHNYPPFD